MILMIYAAMVVIAIAGPLASVQDPGIHQLTPSQQTPDFSASAPATIGKKRATYFQNWQSFDRFNVYWTAFNSILPTAVAAESLLDFYHRVSANAAPGGFWRQFPSPNSHFGARYGYYELDFLCDQRPISWDFVYLFAQFMIRQSSRNFVGIYHAMASIAAEEVEIYVRLRIRQQ